MTGYNDPHYGECECCLFKTDELELTDCYARTPGHGPFTPNHEKQWGWLCNVCRSTLAGNTFMFPRQYDRNTAVILQTIAWQTNFLADVTRQALQSNQQTGREAT